MLESPESGSLPSTKRGNVTIGRRVLLTGEGLIGLAQQFHGNDVRVIVTHGASIAARVQVEAGQLSFPLLSGEVVAPSCFVLILPPRSIVPIRFAAARVDSTGIASLAPLGIDSAALLRCDVAEMPLGRSGLQQLLRAPALAELDADKTVAREIVRARRLLHDHFYLPAPVGRVAMQVDLAAETLIRRFAQAYRVSPKQYCHRARLFEAVLRLLAGGAILETALAVGFNDLSRFYQQFRRILGATPGTYATIKKRQDAP